MSILIDRNTKVIVQGITGQAGKYHTEQCLKYGTKIVAGVSPGKEETEILGVPVYNTVKKAKIMTKANVSIIFVPAESAKDAIIEGIDAELDLVVCITEGIPVLDMIEVKSFMEGKKTRLLGPNCPGIISPSECKVGIMPNNIHLLGNVGIVSRSGTLTYEAVNQLTNNGIGQSTVIGIGGDPISGMSFIDALEMFNDDPNTNAVLMIGEIGGSDEEAAAVWVKAHMKKPVIAYISGQHVPSDRAMGHAGAIVLGLNGTTNNKIDRLMEAGVTIVNTPAEIGTTLVNVLKKNNLF